jgi:aminopeptidase-like protein
LIGDSVLSLLELQITGLFLSAPLSLRFLLEGLGVIEILEGSNIFLNQNSKCEPQLGKWGVCRTTGGDKGARASELAMLWVLNFSDGHHTILDIAEKSALDFGLIKTAADMLADHGLLKD